MRHSSSSDGLQNNDKENHDNFSLKVSQPFSAQKAKHLSFCLGNWEKLTFCDKKMKSEVGHSESTVDCSLPKKGNYSTR